MEITRISGAQELYVFQNTKKTLAIRNNLRLANWNVYARIHNPGGKKGKDKNGDGYPSTLKFTAIEVVEGGENKTVSFNVAPADIRLLYFKLNRMRKDSFEWSADRLHHFNKDKSGYCPMYRMSISRIPKDSRGNAYRSPWFIKILEGTAKPIETDLGSVMAERGSWKEAKSITIMLSDDEYFRCLSTCIRGIELWEEAYAIPHLKAGDILAQLSRAKETCIDKDGVLTITAERAKYNLISFAHSILEMDAQTKTVVKNYNELLEYYSKLTETDFSAFKLQPKKANVK